MELLTGTQVIIGIARIIVVDLELAIVRIPANERHIAVRIARTRICLIPSIITDNLKKRLSVLARYQREIFQEASAHGRTFSKIRQAVSIEFWQIATEHKKLCALADYISRF